MKNFIRLLRMRISGIKIMILSILIMNLEGAFAQKEITGKLVDNKSNEPISFANVSLIKKADSVLISSVISDEKGSFIINSVPKGNYKIVVSIIGYKTFVKPVNVENTGMNAGILFLEDTAITIKETVIFGERVKAKTEAGKTTFFMTKKMIDASNTGTDILKMIPGVQVDLMQNISLEGSRNIQILVNGKERDRIFVSQLNPKDIEKVEIVSKPSSNYDGDVTGAINIILKKEKEIGVNGNVYAEIPTSSSIYVFPAYMLNYGFKKINLYTSYKGEMIYFDQHESTSRELLSSTVRNEIISNQFVRQKDWSHRFNFGMDYFLSARNQLNLFAFINPYSHELNGTAESQMYGKFSGLWKARKEDTDINTSTFCSLFFKHSFPKDGHELTFDLSNYNLNATNGTDYISIENDKIIQSNRVRPIQNDISTKIDYVLPLLEDLKINAGAKTRFQFLKDRLGDFNYSEKILAMYGSAAYRVGSFNINTGLRIEKSIKNLKNQFTKDETSLLPSVNIVYKFTSGQSVQAGYNRSVRRPNIYQLNPYTSIIDPYSITKGNPFLKPEFVNGIFLEYSNQFKSNFASVRVFYIKAVDAINNLTYVNDTGAFETRAYNRGIMHQYGIQFTGSLKIGIVVINPYLRIFELTTLGNGNTREHLIQNRSCSALESGLSSVVTFSHDISFSFIFQYSTPESYIQGSSFCDALYFVSLEKKINGKLKVGLTSALPFTKTFVYNGSDIKESNFRSDYRGNIKLSNLVFFKLSYQFSSGKNRENINIDREEINDLRKKSF